MKNGNEHYLADWLAGTISDGQLRQLVSEDDFKAFQKIKETLENSTFTASDTDHFAVIKQKLAAKNDRGPRPIRSRKIIPIWSYAVAACLILAMGWYCIYFPSNEMLTGYGENKEVVLNDHSKITLNAQSKIGYANWFSFNRTIQLEGEAFFEVEKGSTFTVKTALGNVTVLGTKFNVASFSDYFEVVCYEGKVRVATDAKATLLTKGEHVRFYKGNVENWADTEPVEPLWTNGETDLKKVPMQYVFQRFENQYHLKVRYPKTIEAVKFTGSFTNTNKEKALRSICIPLGLKYSAVGSGTIQISE